MKVAIIGLGTVGRSQARMFRDHILVTYDLADGPYPRDEIARCDFAVIAVGTPPSSDGSADTTQVAAAVGGLPGGMPVLIRSTVPPGTTSRMAARRPGHTAFAPEFLYEGGTGPWCEAEDVPWLLLGGADPAREYFFPRIAAVYPGTIRECSATAAELAKYTANIYWATRVTFVNEMAAIAAAHGVDWEEVREAWLADGRVSPAHTAMAGFPPGFAGRCWPKDLDALIAAASRSGHKPEFLEAVRDANHRFRAP